VRARPADSLGDDTPDSDWTPARGALVVSRVVTPKGAQVATQMAMSSENDAIAMFDELLEGRGDED
jgi:hypothetical protein